MTVTLAEANGQTRLTIRRWFEWLAGRDPGWTRALMKQGSAAGWNDNLDLLVPYLWSLQGRKA